MAVYVDNAYIEAKGKQWCHLVADDLDELIAFGAKIGLTKDNLHEGDHFDVTPWMRNQAVRNGAKEVSQRYAARVWRNMHRKQQGKEPLPLPEE